MKKKKKNRLPLFIFFVLFILVAVFIYFIFNSKNKNALTLEENKWIDSNKYNVIDIAVINDIPIISYNGKGILYDYLDYISDEEGLKFARWWNDRCSSI